MAIALKPIIKLSDSANGINLEQLVPKEFGDWTLDPRANLQVINPQQQAELNSIYSQTLSRTYIHASGRRIMLSLAYGGDQTHDTQIHKPEVCYPAQGFKIVSTAKDQITAASGDIPVMRLVTQLGARNEPVTYWIRVGDKLVRGAVEQNIARVTYGLKGEIPDGLLFRVSEISTDPKASYLLQDAFVNQLLDRVSFSDKPQLVGRDIKEVLNK